MYLRYHVFLHIPHAKTRISKIRRHEGQIRSYTLIIIGVCFWIFTVVVHKGRHAR